MSRESDHDRLIERLLRGTSGEDARPAGAANACLDAERLAAWADRGLTGAESAEIEAHLADCARCRALAAAFVATEPVRAEVERPGRRPIRWVLPLAALGAAAAIVVAIIHSRPSNAPPAELTQLQKTAPLEAPTSPAPVSAAPTTRAKTPATPAPAAPARDQAREKPRAAANNVDERRDAGGVSELAAPPSNLRKVDETAKSAAAAPSATVAEFPTAPSPAVAAQRRQLGSPLPRWRVLASGQVERSLTNGASWEPIAIDPSVFVTAGAAPSAAVCWLVGHQGVVLSSTDAGAHFSRVPPPAVVDLVSIRATDALHATVGAADGRTFTTSNGGASWE